MKGVRKEGEEVVFWNPKAEDLLRPSVGPQHPNRPVKGTHNVFGGLVQDDAMNAAMFDEQMRAFQKTGTSLDPTGLYHVEKNWKYHKDPVRPGAPDPKDAHPGGSKHKKRAHASANDAAASPSYPTSSAPEAEDTPESTAMDVTVTEQASEAQKKADRKATRDPRNVASYLGTWADLSKRPKAPSRAEEEEAKKKKAAEEEGEATEGPHTKKTKIEEASIWHGTAADTSAALGHSWLRAPKELEMAAQARVEAKDSVIDKDLMRLLVANTADEDGGAMSEEGGVQGKTSKALEMTQKFSAAKQNFLPKKCIQTWADAEKGLSAIRFIPQYGHLLLAASMDGKVRVYESASGSKKRLLFTYVGHSQSVRELDWNPDGTKFVTASYDREVRLWDAETGKTVGRFGEKKIVPYCVKFYPLDPNIFLVGQSNSKIAQWDTRSGEMVQEYGGHLGAINSVTFIDQSRRFVSTSDDKTIRVWDYDVPVQIKYIADPKMHSMPCVTVHPGGKYFLAQGLDNKIHVYSTKEKFQPNHKKIFSGHLVSGYACHLSVSPDGRCVTSGDASGHLFFWDWHSSKLIKKLKAHSQTLIDAQWHPLDASRVATAGWDNLVKLWD